MSTSNRLTEANLLIQLGEFEKANRVLDSAKDEDDDWLLLKSICLKGLLRWEDLESETKKRSSSSLRGAQLFVESLYSLRHHSKALSFIASSEHRSQLFEYLCLLEFELGMFRNATEHLLHIETKTQAFQSMHREIFIVSASLDDIVDVYGKEKNLNQYALLYSVEVLLRANCRKAALKLLEGRTLTKSPLCDALVANANATGDFYPEIHDHVFHREIRHELSFFALGKKAIETHQYEVAKNILMDGLSIFRESYGLLNLMQTVFFAIGDKRSGAQILAELVYRRPYVHDLTFYKHQIHAREKNSLKRYEDNLKDYLNFMRNLNELVTTQ